MPLSKGQPSKAYLEGKLQKKDFRSRTPEEMKEIHRRAVESRVKKNKARKAMREQLQELLKMDVSDKQAREELFKLGLEDADVSNQMLLMVALFKRAMTGDVSAIKQIDDMTNGIVPETATQPVVINIQTATKQETSTKVTGQKGSVLINEVTEDDEEWPEE